MSKLFYFIGDALKGLKRNFSVTLASIFTVLLTLFIFGMFMMLAVTTNTIVRNVEEKIEVTVFLNKNVSEDTKKNIESKIKEQYGILEVKYESKEEAFNKAKETMADYLKDRDPVKNNPFPASFIVRLQKAEYIDKFIKNLSGVKGIEEIGNADDTVKKIVSIGRTLKIAGFVIFALLILVSLFLIGNTIKLAVYGRKKEIEIMKFVGATNWFIRWPFILEGIIIGVIGAIGAIALLYFGYRYAFTQLTVRLPFITLPSPSYIRNTLSWQFTLAGIGIGAVGSFLSIRKHLNV